MIPVHWCLLHPRYISTVDSGNLAGHLLTLKQGLLGLRHQKIINPRLFEGLATTAAVLGEKLVKSEKLNSFRGELEITSDAALNDLEKCRLFLEKVIDSADEIFHSLENEPESEAFWWAKAFSSQARNNHDELMMMTPWLFLPPMPEKFTELEVHTRYIPTLFELATIEKRLVPEVNKYYLEDNTVEENEWLDRLRRYITDAGRRAKERILILERLAQQCSWISNMEYDFLFDKTKNLLSIGYNAEEHRKDISYYDLLGSESRLAVFVAISQGKIPQESWFALGRQLTNPGTSPVLLSWSGSMFEYLMPYW